MTLTLTIVLLAMSVSLTVFAGWRGAQPPDLHKGPRMVPWRFVMLLSGAFSVLLLVHLAALAGAPTRPVLPMGRNG
jgi:hypothetical protein